MAEVVNSFLKGTNLKYLWYIYIPRILAIACTSFNSPMNSGANPSRLVQKQNMLLPVLGVAMNRNINEIGPTISFLVTNRNTFPRLLSSFLVSQICTFLRFTSISSSELSSLGGTPYCSALDFHFSGKEKEAMARTNGNIDVIINTINNNI